MSGLKVPTNFACCGSVLFEGRTRAALNAEALVEKE